MLLFKEKFYFIVFFSLWDMKATISTSPIWKPHKLSLILINFIPYLSLYPPTHPSMCVHVCKYAGALVWT